MLVGPRPNQLMETQYQCHDCGWESALVTFWNATEGSYEIICGTCRRNDLEPRKSITQMWKDDPGSVPIHIANKLERKYGVESMTTTALATITQQQMIKRIDRARWTTQLTSVQKELLADAAVQYGYDPAMGELIIYEGRLYVTIAGRIRDAHRVPGFQGIEDRPMTQDEKTAYGITEPVAWIARAYRADWKVPAVGTATANPLKPHRGNDVERLKPQWMARSRAIRQCIQLLAPSSLPFGNAEDAGLMVDTQTGEILVGEAREVPDEPQSQPTPEVLRVETQAAVAQGPQAEAVKPAISTIEASFATMLSGCNNHHDLRDTFTAIWRDPRRKQLPDEAQARITDYKEVLKAEFAAREAKRTNIELSPVSPSERLEFDVEEEKAEVF